jgi:hypothetical protein
MAIGKIGFYTFDLYGAWLPLLLILAPPLLVKYIFPTRQSITQKYWHGVGYLIGAAVSWAASIHIPNLPVGGSESVTTHLMGGGLVAPFLFVYCKRRYINRDRTQKIYETLGLAFNPMVLRFAMLFAFSCTFGVVNELAELVFVSTAMDTIILNDTGSDLTANTVGTVVAFIGMELWRLRPARKVERMHDETIA